MNPHLRMEKILAIIEANPGINGQKIADICAVPWGVIQNDLATIIMATENPIPLYTDADDIYDTHAVSETDEADGADDDNFETEINAETKWFLDTYTRRNVPLHLTLGEALQVLDLAHVDESQPKLLSLKQKVLESLDLDPQENYRYIKGNMSTTSSVDNEVLLLIEQAIKRRRKISFTYKSRLSTVSPLGLVYYSRLRQWYLVTEADGIIKTFNLSKMQELKETPQPFNYPSDFSLRDWLAPRWGMEFGEPMQVKVRFSNRSQTVGKVRKDVAHRQCKLSLENGDETLLYEDTVIGKNEFIAWILGFGSAAEVLEPAELRDEIITRVRETLANYM